MTALTAGMRPRDPLPSPADGAPMNAQTGIQVRDALQSISANDAEGAARQLLEVTRLHTLALRRYFVAPPAGPEGVTEDRSRHEVAAALVAVLERVSGHHATSLTPSHRLAVAGAVLGLALLLVDVPDDERTLDEHRRVEMLSAAIRGIAHITGI